MSCAVVTILFFSLFFFIFFFFQAEDGIRDLVRSRGLGDVYKRQAKVHSERIGGNALQIGIFARQAIDGFHQIIYF